MNPRGKGPNRPDEPVRLVLCAGEMSVGGGAGRMSSYLHKFLNPDLFSVSLVVTDERPSSGIVYDSDIECQFTGRGNRFESLLELFAEADIVSFSSGGFEPLVCEAALSSGVPALVEVMHNVDRGQLYEKIDLTICVSEAVKKAQPYPNKTRVIHNGVDIDSFPFRDRPAAEEKIIILEACRREKQMFFHLDELADDILSLDPAIEIWLAGPGQTGESTEKVKYLGLRTDMPGIYRQADLMARLSVMEPFGLVALEAMASGCLPLVADDGGMAEIVTHGVDGWLVPAHDKQAIISTIREAVSLRSSSKWADMARAVRKTVERKFSIRRCVAEHERAYLELIERKGRRERRGPEAATSPPEVDVADAVQFFNEGRWDMVEDSMTRMAARPAPLKEKHCAWSALQLAREAVTRGRQPVARKTYRKLYESGLRDVTWMKEWAGIFRKDEPMEFLLDELMALEPDNPRWVMLSVERSLASGGIDQALKALEEGVNKIPQSAELSEVYEALRRRLGISK